MSWTTVGPGSASWVTAGSSALSWGDEQSSVVTWTPEGSSAVSYSADTQTSRVWAQLSPIVVEGVDFRLEMTESYPMRMVEDRPVTIADVFPEGIP